MPDRSKSSGVSDITPIAGQPSPVSSRGSVLRLIIIALFSALSLLFLGVPLILHALLTGSADRLYWVAMWVVKKALQIGGVRVRVEGLENIPKGACVFVSNHTSAADPPAVVGSIPRRVSLLAKKELFRVPIFGTAMRVAGLVPIDRSKSEAAIASVERAIEYLQQGRSFLVYPEGTRSPDGRLLPFKKGSFVMAIRAGVPIVPISVAGAEKVMPKGNLLIHPGEIRVRFHPCIDTTGYTVEQRDELVERVHAAVASGLRASQ